MGIYQQQLPQLAGKKCITDAGMETEFVFQKQIDLPEFAAYDLLRSEQGYGILFDYYKIYAELAVQHKLGLILETPTWRANADWGNKIGDSKEALHKFNIAAVKLIEKVREEYETENSPIVVSGNIGPRGDGYSPDKMMTVVEAQNYHLTQIQSFSTANVDLVTALTINYIEEGVGITLAAKQCNLPVCISFTVETDGLLPTGDTLEQAIQNIDKVTENYPVYYMINCSHPTHFNHLFKKDEAWTNRIKGLRANASCLSHAELDESEFLDDGDPDAFGKELKDLQDRSSHITVLGGCCGTDHRHIEQVCLNITSD
ncbi:MAG: homocysteine S-methyltransferase family protein [Gammaproteobacteria bacterium]|jgi:S-methylmethionine-dependent homocysteine/selenocysteine methylase|nr:homocysteine S-methyltransferase family protein [Gammaproteobacteria bacterium]